jgi:hypothetical protein
MEQKGVPANPAQPGRLSDESKLQPTFSWIADDPVLKSAPLEPRFEVEAHLQRAVIRSAALVTIDRLIPSPLLHRQDVMADGDCGGSLRHKSGKESPLSFGEAPDGNSPQLAAGPNRPGPIEDALKVESFCGWNSSSHAKCPCSYLVTASSSLSIPSSPR